MKIGILGTGMVGNTLGTALIAKGHEGKMGAAMEQIKKLWSGQKQMVKMLLFIFSK